MELPAGLRTAPPVVASPAGTRNVPLGCSPGTREISHVAGESVESFHFLVTLEGFTHVDAEGFDLRGGFNIEKHDAAVGS